MSKSTKEKRIANFEITHTFPEGVIFSNKVELSFSEETLTSIGELGSILNRIRNRLIDEGKLVSGKKSN